MKIFLDFDRTLYDLDAFHEEARKICETSGISRAMYDASKGVFSTLSGMQGGSYTPECHETELEKLHLGTSRHLAEHIRSLARKGARFLFADVEGFFRMTAGYERIILTFGDDEYQRYKIAGSGLDTLAERIIVTDGSKWDVMRRELALGEAAIFVDDHGGYFSEKPEGISVCGIHLVRAGQEDCGSCLAHTHVGDLAETLQIIRKYPLR